MVHETCPGAQRKGIHGRARLGGLWGGRGLCRADGDRRSITPITRKGSSKDSPSPGQSPDLLQGELSVLFQCHRESARVCAYVRCRWSGTGIEEQVLELSDLAA